MNPLLTTLSAYLLSQRWQTILKPNRRFCRRASWTVVATVLCLAACAIPPALILTARAGTAERPAVNAPPPSPPSASSHASGAAASSRAAPTASNEPPPALLTAFGRVLDPAGKPLAGATVYFREWSTYRMTANIGVKSPEDLDDILATRQTDAQGAFLFENVPARPLRSEQLKNIPWDVVVVAKPYAMAWRHLQAAEQQEPFEITLAPEAQVAGRVVDPQGKPIHDARVALRSIDPLDSDWPCTAYADPGELNLQLSKLAPPARTDADGRVAFAGLPRDARLSFDVTARGFQHGGVFVAATDRPLPEIEVPGFFDGTKRTHKAKIFRSDFTVTLAPPPAPWLVGQVLAADTKKPLLARIPIFVQGTLTTTDPEGRFALRSDVHEPRCRLHVYSPRGTDYLGRVLFVDVPKAKKPLQLDIALDRGEILKGLVVDGETGRGIAGVHVAFDTGLDVHTTTVGGPVASGAQSDREGRFRLVVPPGKGTVRISGEIRGYDLPRPSGRPADVAGFFKEVEVVASKPTAEVKFALHRVAQETEQPLQRRERSPQVRPIDKASKTVRYTVEGKIIDPGGKPVAGVEVGFAPWWMYGAGDHRGPARSDPQGRFSLDCISRDASLRLLVAIDHKERLRGHVQLPTGPLEQVLKSPLEIDLAPTGVVRGRAMDGDTPISGAQIQLLETMPPTEHTSGKSTVSNWDTVRTDGDGRFEFPFVEARKTFAISVSAKGYTEARANGRVAVGQTLQLEPFSLMRLDKSIAGIVVDRDGKPVAGALVTAQMRSGQHIPNATNKRPTGEDGRFVIRGVPNVPLAVQAYIRPQSGAQAGERPTSSLVNAAPGQTDVRIVLDPKRTP